MFRPLRFGAAIGLSALIFIGPLNPVGAGTPTPDPVAPGNSAPTAVTTYGLMPSEFALTVSPTRLSIGQADIDSTQEVLVVNRGLALADITVQKRDFTAASDGSLSYQERAPYSAADWITLEPEKFELEPGAAQIVTAQVTIPGAPEPGDHQVVLVFVVPAGESGANVKINRGIGVPVYVTAPGPVDDSVSLRNLVAPNFATSGPVTITASMQNTGTVHRDFRGTSPLIVDVPGTTIPFPDFTVTRGATRDISTTWDPPLVGIFNPTVTFTNADGSVQSQSVRVIIFPIQKALILLGALLVLFFGFWFLRRRYRSSVRKAAVAMSHPVGQGDA